MIPCDAVRQSCGHVDADHPRHQMPASRMTCQINPDPSSPACNHAPITAAISSVIISVIRASGANAYRTASHRHTQQTQHPPQE
jgi:hypothetical protein